jgi:hypothetical protein
MQVRNPHHPFLLVLALVLVTLPASIDPCPHWVGVVVVLSDDTSEYNLGHHYREELQYAGKVEPKIVLCSIDSALENW